MLTWDQAPSVMPASKPASRTSGTALPTSVTQGYPYPRLSLAGEKVKHLAAVKSVCEEVSEQAATIVSEGLFPIFLGGDHAISIGTVSGVARSTPGVRTGVIWVDAHADFNTPATSPSGNIHGMPLATLTGLGHPDLVGIGGPGASVRTEDVVIIGLRSVDVEEKKPAARGRRESLHHEGYRCLRRGARRA